ncbi:D-beta-hydroxybutyrate dehydrogenase, mitochondrial-like [Asterias rubens]|uniref:D-beta-hydroxybutyrate dehydrogenase, mitochondrial-like n=1 Tax=Asterias rubens TaxID=7604 RepID=UPI0014552F66|nr:D-beta-hydroxybutyrate dehydrogenase, mitochondrial-like [Asterias rubens]
MKGALFTYDYDHQKRINTIACKHSHPDHIFTTSVGTMVDITAKKSGVFLLCAFVFIWYIVPRLGEEFLSRCFGNIISLILAYVIAIQLNEGKIEIQGKAVLVTGCDTGIGNAVARYLDKLGFRVFAGCLFEDGTGARRLKDECSGRMQVVQMDVTNEHQVAEVARFVQSAVAVSGEVLWGVVNNAGIAVFGEVEWLSLDDYQRVVNINLWGMIRVTKAFLPMIRQCKGRIVNMSSIQGLFGAPFISTYSISKYSVEAFSDCLRYEMAKWGVKTIIIEPGNFSSCSDLFEEKNITKMLETVWSKTPDHIKEDYGQEYFNDMVKSMANTRFMSANSLEPVQVAVEDALIDENPQIRYFPSNIQSKIFTWIFCYLPPTLTDYLFKVAVWMSTVKVKGIEKQSLDN